MLLNKNYILSIDIAIKNLAFCLFDYTNSKIIDWKLINLLKDIEADNFCNNIKCSSITKKNIKCIKNALYESNNEYFCTIHSKKIENKTLLKNKLKCSIDKCTKDIKYYDKNNGYCNIHKKKTNVDLKRYYTVDNINDNELRILLFKELDLYDFSSVKKILIEKQPKMASEKMRSVSYAVYDYFIIKLNYNSKVIWVDPKNKLTIYNGPIINCPLEIKDSYDRNKWFACQYCDYFLKEKNELNNLNFFKLNKKKDDLADCYLQGIYYIEYKNKKNIMTDQQKSVYIDQNILKYNKIKKRKPKLNKTKYTLSEIKYLITNDKNKSNNYNYNLNLKNSIKYYFGDENYFNKNIIKNKDDIDKNKFDINKNIDINENIDINKDIDINKNINKNDINIIKKKIILKKK